MEIGSSFCKHSKWFSNTKLGVTAFSATVTKHYISKNILGGNLRYFIEPIKKFFKQKYNFRNFLPILIENQKKLPENGDATGISFATCCPFLLLFFDFLPNTITFLDRSFVLKKKRKKKQSLKIQYYCWKLMFNLLISSKTTNGNKILY